MLRDVTLFSHISHFRKPSITMRNILRLVIAASLVGAPLAHATSSYNRDCLSNPYGAGSPYTTQRQLLCPVVSQFGNTVTLLEIATDALIGPDREIWESLGGSEIKAQSFTRRHIADWFEQPGECTPADKLTPSL